MVALGLGLDLGCTSGVSGLTIFWGARLWGQTKFYTASSTPQYIMSLIMSCLLSEARKLRPFLPWKRTSWSLNSPDAVLSNQVTVVHAKSSCCILTSIGCSCIPRSEIAEALLHEITAVSLLNVMFWIIPGSCLLPCTYSLETSRKRVLQEQGSFTRLTKGYTSDLSACAGTVGIRHMAAPNMRDERSSSTRMNGRHATH